MNDNVSPLTNTNAQNSVIPNRQKVKQPKCPSADEQEGGISKQWKMI